MQLFSPELLEAQIPYYLTQEAKQNLVVALKNFPRDINYYTSRYPDELLQGDGWASLELVRFEDGQKKAVKGIILSNSCDIDSNNKRSIPVNFVFSPIVKLNKYLDKFKQAGLQTREIENKAKTIRAQGISTLFYLPQGAGLDAEYVALLDDLHTLSIAAFETRSDRSKLFTLSQVGFYIFLFKLSIHFCRFHENLNRD